MSSLHLDERNAVLHAQGGDKLLVHGLVAVLGQDAQQRLASADFKITVVCYFISLLRCLPDVCQAPWQPHGHRGRDRRR